MIEVKHNADEFSKQLDGLLLEIDRQLDSGFQRWTLKVFYDLVVNTPQWSGDTAANWNYSIGLPNFSYQQTVGKSLYWQDKGYSSMEPLQKGDMAAVWAAYSRAEDGPMPRWKDKVFLANAAPVAQELEDMSIPVRIVNLVDKKVVMAKFIADKWSKLPA